MTSLTYVLRIWPPASGTITDHSTCVSLLHLPLHLVPNSWHMIGISPHMMQEPLMPSSAKGDSSVSPKPHSSTIAMEAREGRSGNAFACERCKQLIQLHAHPLTSTGRKHKVRCVPSDTASVCQRYVFPALFRTLGITRAPDARKHELSASSMLHAEGQPNPGQMGRRPTRCATSTRSWTKYLPLWRPWHRSQSSSPRCRR